VRQAFGNQRINQTVISLVLRTPESGGRNGEEQEGSSLDYRAAS